MASERERDSPYIAEYEADCPKEPSQVTKDSWKIKLLASMLLDKFNRKAAKTRDPKLTTSDAAEDVMYKKLVDGRKKAPAGNSIKQVFGAEFLETKPEGIIHGVLDPEDAGGRICQNVKSSKTPCLINLIC